MDNFSNGVGLVSTILVGFALVGLLLIGISTVVRKLKSIQQFESKNYITQQEALALKEQNESIIGQLKKLSKPAN